MRFGLALGGGGARGVAHIPVLETFDELGIRPSVISGTSIGAIMGAAYASGMTGVEIREFALDRFAKRSELISRLWQVRPRSIMDWINGNSGAGQVDAERVVEVFLPESLPVRIEDCGTAFSCVATDFYSGTPVVLNSGSLRQSIAASIALPFLFKPVQINGRYLVDGGFVDPVPVSHIRDEAEFIIAVDVVGKPVGDPTTMPGAFETLIGGSQILMNTIAREKARYAPAEITLIPDIHEFKVLDFYQVKDILAASEPMKDELKRALSLQLDK
ncbi:MAG: patatin-like phospholipase family protein [Cohaesibacteraceae bacterium]|nr:patatin-like phospholipase family protein [Cohaesibacteraceae bacterium]MBL4874884.1 patatin-like phospholipase family protein [Cohaesibacteraceae bacterium]